MRIYVSGPYTADTPTQIEENIDAAREAALELLRMGHTPFCPHTHTAFWDVYGPDLPDERFLRLGLDWLERCDAILLLPGWENSEGSKVEMGRAEELELQVFDDIEMVPPA